MARSRRVSCHGRTLVSRMCLVKAATPWRPETERRPARYPRMSTNRNTPEGPETHGNARKDPDEWVTGDSETMTGAQAFIFENTLRRGGRAVRSGPHQGGGLEAHRRVAGEDGARPGRTEGPRARPSLRSGRGADCANGTRAISIRAPARLSRSTSRAGAGRPRAAAADAAARA